MNIYTVNASLSTTEKIALLNSMILQLNGMIAKAAFDQNEITALYEDLGSTYTRKYLRDILLGNTISDYTDWSHLKEETGYSIWKLTPDSYAYDIINQLYFDNAVLENRGEANSELATIFDKVFVYNGDTYVDNTTEAGTEGGTSFDLFATTSGYLYVGLSTTFSGIKFEFDTPGSGYTNKVEYYNGAWTELTINTNNLNDQTSNFESDGRITWTIPGDWSTVVVNSQTKYWIRISTTTTPVTTATAYYIIPNNSVISLLALSSQEISEEDWAWCSYNDSIYVTIRNTGASAYEGDYFIKSSSSVTNLKNFFCYNHQYSLNHLNSNY